MLNARATPKLFNTCGLRLFEISVKPFTASLITYSVLARISRWVSFIGWVDSAEMLIRTDDNNGPKPSCSSFEMICRWFSSARITALNTRFSLLRRCSSRRAR